LRRLYYE